MPETEKKLFLLDAMALIYRAYFAFSNNHRINSKNQNTSAIFGFTNTLLDLLKKENPTHLAIVFDTAAPTERHQEFEDYKANRQEIPEDLAAAIPQVHQLADAMNIPVLLKDGYEADDIIGTLALKASSKGFKTYMMTPDKDYGQLVSDKILIYKPARAGGNAEVLGPKEICARWSINNPSQVVEILGLMGDKVDNIPGIPGVGEKTAMQLIGQYTTIDNLLKNTHELKGKLREKVETNREMALQSKRLATIITDVDLPVEPEDLKVQPWNKEALIALFNELEFRRLPEQLGLISQTESAKSRKTKPEQTTLFGNEPELDNPLPPGDFATSQTVKHSYKIVQTEAEIKELINSLLSQKSVCFDTETTSTDALTAELVGLSFSFVEHEAYYIPVPANRKEAESIVQLFSNFFSNDKIEKSGQNLKYDMTILSRYGITIRGALFDTMIAHFILHPEMRHNMDALAETYLHYSPISIETLIGKKGKSQGSMRDVPLEQIAEYAAEDADVTFQLKGKLQKELKLTGTIGLFEEVEMPLVPVLTAMECEGINLDPSVLTVLSLDLQADIVKSEKEIQDMAGTEFNISSPRQVGEVLFDNLKISDNPQKTKTGQYSTAEDVLAKLENRHPIVRSILDYRELVKLKNTYVDVLPTMINTETGRLHTSFNQVVAVTGRLSSDNPNLQNIPIRTARGREIRKAFVPRSSDYLLLSADYSQIELRIIAELSGDAGMIAAFESGEDIHASTAAKVYNIPLAEVTSEMRRNAKMVNFGIIYGISAFGLAERLNISRTEAKEIIENYFKQYPAIREYMDESIAKARKQGYVETILGRRRYLRDINSANQTVRGFAERNAINAPIQGSAADMIKVAMIRIHHELQQKKLRSKMLLQVHDELVFDVLKSELDEVKEMVLEKMKTALPLKVPVEVGIGTGSNWLEAH